MIGIRLSVLAAAAGLFMVSARAQPATPPPPLPPATPGSPSTIPEKTPSSPGTTGSSSTLSDKLDKSDGVIKPPGDVDPAMSKTAPSTGGNMPVVKPPEDKGGPTAK